MKIVRHRCFTFEYYFSLAQTQRKKANKKKKKVNKFIKELNKTYN